MLQRCEYQKIALGWLWWTGPDSKWRACCHQSTIVLCSSKRSPAAGGRVCLQRHQAAPSSMLHPCLTCVATRKRHTWRLPWLAIYTVRKCRGLMRPLTLPIYHLGEEEKWARSGDICPNICRSSFVIIMRCLLGDKVRVKEGRVQEGRGHRTMRREDFWFLFGFSDFHLLELKISCIGKP